IEPALRRRTHQSHAAARDQAGLVLGVRTTGVAATRSTAMRLAVRGVARRLAAGLWTAAREVVIGGFWRALVGLACRGLPCAAFGDRHNRRAQAPVAHPAAPRH